ncbi:type II toxin-antitoxin system RelE/ParE family toxin [Achromobacter xylosoxidans]|nr:type II toxin-antitoxin system RelE/ParE family toxin [Achromobacter xylosoxidans]
MTRPYVLSRGAAADLRGIVRHTLETWGEAQAVAYVAELETAACEVAQGQGVFKQLDELLPGLRVRRAGRHVLFCLPRHNRQALILAILHERMDLMARLKERLGL